MSKYSKSLVLIPTVLLLCRALLPAVQGQNNPGEWSLKGSTEGSFRDSKPSFFPANARGQVYWPLNVESAPGILSRDMTDSASSTSGLSRSDGLQHSSDIYLLSYGQKLPHKLNLGVNVDTFNSNADPKKPSQPQGVVTTNGAYDLLEEPAPQLSPEYPNPLYSDEVVQISAKPRPKLRQVGLPPRYMMFSNLKRNIARDGYMCHFKLCQVGVSGKRLSGM